VDVRIGMAASSKSSDPLVIGRYELHEAIASGGMATVHMGRMAGPAGFSRPVAIKRLHAHLAKDPEFVAMFLDEARLAARIQHPNVVGTLDVVAMGGELFLVMEYIQGETLARLWRATCGAGQSIDARITATVMSNVLHGLHAAHEAKNERIANATTCSLTSRPLCRSPQPPPSQEAQCATQSSVSPCPCALPPRARRARATAPRRVRVMVAPST
jgi:serine/threonine protein kinase